MKLSNFSKRFLFLLSVFIGDITFARSPTFEMIGEGSASAKAEFMKLTISVRGECLGSSTEARRSVDVQVAEVLKILTEYTDSTVEKQLQVYPGNNFRRAKIRYEEGREITLCDLNHGWNSSSTIVFKLANLEQLDETQDALLMLNDALSPQSGFNQPLLEVTLGAPQAGVFSTTYEKLTDQALGNAFDNALRQANLFFNRTSHQGTLILTRVSPTHEPSGAVLYDRAAAVVSPESAAVIDITVSVSRKFTFKVESP